MHQRVRALFRYFKNYLVTLRVTILSIFITLFVIAIISLIFINYAYFSKIHLLSAMHVMDKISYALQTDLSDELDRAKKDDALSANLIQQGVVNTKNIQELILYTFNLAKEFKITDGAYWADEQGTLVYSKYEENDTITTEVIDRSVNPPQQYFIYRDSHNNTIKQAIAKPTDIHYDPRKMAWYHAAKEQKKTIFTNVIPYGEAPYFGITVASPVYSDNKTLRGVFGMDFRLDWLSWYVNELKFTPHIYIFIISSNGDLIAFPGVYKKEGYAALVNIHSLNVPWVAKSFDLYKTHSQTNFTFEYNHRLYLAAYKAIPQFADYGWFVGMVVPIEDFVGEIKKISLLNMGIGMFILAIGIALISHLVTRIVRPINQVVHQTEKIKHLELDEAPKIQTHIKEVHRLSNAIQAMRVGLKSFQRYIPSTLVRQLIEAGEHAHVGGNKKILTIFFSDIKNFTTIAETMDPNQLMERMCEYFEELSNIIIDEKGTIDKYIGDSIMAFWGAPLPVEHPCHASARAALRCKDRLILLNQHWENQGKEPLITRMGIHMGEAIVGNVGSTERLNYTAFGDTINVASRLESINKVYGTSIIVSESVYKIIKDQFVMRLIDHVSLKGKTGSGHIYELLAMHKNELPFDIDSYQETFAKAFATYQQGHWNDAIQFFEACLRVYPQDTLAPVFIHRCYDLKDKTPSHWDGVWRVNES